MRIAMVLGLLAGCSLYDGDEMEPTVDAGPSLCEPTAARNVSCRSICSETMELCAGADWTACFEECRSGVSAVAWCPGQQ